MYQILSNILCLVSAGIASKLDRVNKLEKNPERSDFEILRNYETKQLPKILPLYLDENKTFNLLHMGMDIEYI